MKYTVEIRVTISPTPRFFRAIHYMAASLRAIGGLLTDHEIVVSVGGNSRRENLYRSQAWSNRYPILWRWVDPVAYAAMGYRATNHDRAWHMSRSRFVMIADADVIFLRDFSELLSSIETSPAVCGVMAHVSPFLQTPTLVDPSAAAADSPASVYWRLLAQRFGITNLPLKYQYTGWKVMFEREGHQFGPAYFNGGMVLGPTDLMEEMLASYPAAEGAVDSVMDSYFRPQLARTLAIYRARLPHKVLPLRYNFPNDPRFDDAYRDELPKISVLHYLRTEIVDREKDFMDAKCSARFIARTDLRGTNELLRRRIAELHDTVVAEEGASRSRWFAKLF
jgi:hypothetical protein